MRIKIFWFSFWLFLGAVFLVAQVKPTPDAECVAPKDVTQVPLCYANRILYIQRDAQNIQNRDIQLKAQFDADQQTLVHDSQEVEQVKQEALKFSGRDAKTTDINMAANPLAYITKAADAKPEPAKK